MDTQNIIISPIITEKAMKEAQRGKYSFAVVKAAAKTAIKQAIEDMFKVNIVSLQTSIVKGRQKRIGARRIETTEAPWKKAIARLKKGEKISLFEPGGTESESKEAGEKKKKK